MHLYFTQNVLAAIAFFNIRNMIDTCRLTQILSGKPVSVIDLIMPSLIFCLDR